MDEQRRLGDKRREGDVEVARSLAVPAGQNKVPSLKCSLTSTPLQGSRQRPLSAPLRGSLYKAPGFAGGYLLALGVLLGTSQHGNRPGNFQTFWPFCEPAGVN